MIYLSFPVFNIYGTSLLILTLQGLLFGVLLLRKYIQKGYIPYLLLAVILGITCFHQVAYTIGFMGWYDAYRTTKINYLLVDSSLALAPLIMLYVLAFVDARWTFSKRDLWHFLPMGVYFVFKGVIFIHDVNQPGFDQVQNGLWLTGIEYKYIEPIIVLIKSIQMPLYLAFAFQAYVSNRKNLQRTDSHHSDWIFYFLIIYTFLFLYSTFQVVVDTMIVDLSWIQEWWYYLISSMAIVFVGTRGYFLRPPVEGLDDRTKNAYGAKESRRSDKLLSLDVSLIKYKESLLEYMREAKPFLDPELTLVKLANALKINRSLLSEIINEALQKNFNDFVNEYRVEEVIRQFKEGRQEQLSIMGIATNAGFNSKATFNRVFRKFKGESPSDYLLNK